MKVKRKVYLCNAMINLGAALVYLGIIMQQPKQEINSATETIAISNQSNIKSKGDRTDEL